MKDCFQRFYLSLSLLSLEAQLTLFFLSMLLCSTYSFLKGTSSKIANEKDTNVSPVLW